MRHFGSIGYLPDAATVAASARCFAAAVKLGGVVLVEPRVTSEAYREGKPRVQSAKTEDFSLARACVDASG